MPVFNIPVQMLQSTLATETFEHHVRGGECVKLAVMPFKHDYIIWDFAEPSPSKDSPHCNKKKTVIGGVSYCGGRQWSEMDNCLHPYKAALLKWSLD